MPREQENLKFNPIDALALTGLNIQNGYVFDEFLPELQGVRGRKIYREMADNNAIIGALLTAINSHLSSAKWRVDPSPNDTTGEHADFVESVMDDMEHTWQEFIQEALTKLVFGFSVNEMVFKLRLGMSQKDPSRKSQHNDGKIGIRKIIPIAQESISRWALSEDNREVVGVYQWPDMSPQEIFIPLAKTLHFKTVSKKQNPEGRSLLRNAYRSYYFLKQLQMIEAIGVERDLAGLPVMYVPADYFNEANKASTLDKFKQIVRDVRLNSQGGVVLPSNPYLDADGKPTNMKQVELTLLSSGGTRAIDPNIPISRYESNIARTWLADFLMLGQSSVGSFALSKSKTQLFLKAMESIMMNIQAVINRKMVSDLWQLNGFDLEMKPRICVGDIAPIDLEELGNYLDKLTGAGVPIAGDQATESVLRQAADLPEEPVFDLDREPQLGTFDNGEPTTDDQPFN